MPVCIQRHGKDAGGEIAVGSAEGRDVFIVSRDVARLNGDGQIFRDFLPVYAELPPGLDKGLEMRHPKNRRRAAEQTPGGITDALSRLGSQGSRSES